ncbi:MAG: helix-turn-helix transcriptional regulator [Cellulomonas sp.]|nr:helix-turn-helix transcriptional regulator [Cellulomonas sp.]
MEPSSLVPLRRGSSWRRAIGHVLREARLDRGLRLADVCERAGLSPQYLSEIERGRKEASSQVLAAVTAALGLTLVELAASVATQLGAPDVRHTRIAPAPGAGDLGRPAVDRTAVDRTVVLDLSQPAAGYAALLDLGASGVGQAVLLAA